MSTIHELPLFPLGTVLFPGMMLPLHIFEDRYKAMMQNCLTQNTAFGVVLIQEGREVGGGPTTIFETGTSAQITQLNMLEDGRMNIATLGVERFRILETYSDRQPYLVGLVEDYPIQDVDNPATTEIADQLHPLLSTYLDLLNQASDVNIQLEKLPKDAEALAYLTAIILQAPMQDKQKLLNMASLTDILRTEKELLSQEAHLLKLMTQNAPKWRDSASPFSPN